MCNSVSEIINLNFNLIFINRGKEVKKKVSVEGIRKERSDKKTRVNSSLDQDTHRKLKKLAISCGMTKTMLAAKIIEMAVNNESVIDWFQKKYNTDDDYRIIPVKIQGKIHY